jgi:hypothetical protein
MQHRSCPAHVRHCLIQHVYCPALVFVSKCLSCTVLVFRPLSCPARVRPSLVRPLCCPALVQLFSQSFFARLVYARARPFSYPALIFSGDIPCLVRPLSSPDFDPAFVLPARVQSSLLMPLSCLLRPLIRPLHCPVPYWLCLVRPYLDRLFSGPYLVLLLFSYLWYGLVLPGPCLVRHSPTLLFSSHCLAWPLSCPFALPHPCLDLPLSDPPLSGPCLALLFSMLFPYMVWHLYCPAFVWPCPVRPLSGPDLVLPFSSPAVGTAHDLSGLVLFSPCLVRLFSSLSYVPPLSGPSLVRLLSGIVLACPSLLHTFCCLSAVLPFSCLAPSPTLTMTSSSRGRPLSSRSPLRPLSCPALVRPYIFLLLLSPSVRPFLVRPFSCPSLTQTLALSGPCLARPFVPGS